MATEIGSPPRFFHMPRFQHQAPRQLFYKRPDFAQQQAMQQLTFDGKRMRKAVNRKTIDYNPSVIKYLENRIWQRDQRDMRAIQPDAGYYNDLVPPIGMLNNPMNAVTTKFVRTSTRLLVVDPETDEHFKRLRVVPTEEHVEGPLPSPVTNGTSPAQLNGGSVCSSRSDLPGSEKDNEDGSTWKRDPFQESGLHLSPTAAEAKEKARATRVNKRAPQMDWNRKREIFSNF